MGTIKHWAATMIQKVKSGLTYNNFALTVIAALLGYIGTKQDNRIASLEAGHAIHATILKGHDDILVQVCDKTCLKYTPQVK